MQNLMLQESSLFKSLYDLLSIQGLVLKTSNSVDCFIFTVEANKIGTFYYILHNCLRFERLDFDLMIDLIFFSLISISFDFVKCVSCFANFFSKYLHIFGPRSCCNLGGNLSCTMAGYTKIDSRYCCQWGWFIKNRWMYFKYALCFAFKRNYAEIFTCCILTCLFFSPTACRS